MNNVKQYTFTLFCCSLIVSVIEFIVRDSCKKQVSYITGMIMLITILSPMTYLLKQFEIEDTTIHDVSTVYVDQYQLLAEQFKYNLSEIIRDKLETNGIIAEDIRIEIVMSDNEVRLKNIEVILNFKDREAIDKVKQQLEQYLKVEISVHTAGGLNSG